MHAFCVVGRHWGARVSEVCLELQIKHPDNSPGSAIGCYCFRGHEDIQTGTAMEKFLGGEHAWKGFAVTPVCAILTLAGGPGRG